jgi:hypothetical protein
MVVHSIFCISYAHDGIKALADYFMAKYVLQVNTNFGPFGATNKNNTRW